MKKTSEDQSLPIITKRIRINPSFHCEHPAKPSLDVARMCVKRFIFFKIKFGNFISQTGSKRMMKRNLKFLKGTRYCHFKRSPSFYIWKLADYIEGKSTREGGYFGDKVAPISLPTCAAMKTTNFLLKLAKNHITTRALHIQLKVASEVRQERQHAKQLQEVRMLRLSNFCDERCMERYSLTALAKISFFTHLYNLSLDFRENLNTENFYNIFETLADLTSLTSLAVKANLEPTNPSKQNLEKTVAKFEKLRRLYLRITVSRDLKDTRENFVSLGHFNSIKYLKFEIFTSLGFDHHDIIMFVVSHKRLETLKFKVQHMRYNEYDELFGGLQKMKALEKLCVLQRERFSLSLEFNVVLQTLKLLKKLQSFKLHLGYYGIDPNEMSRIFKCLFKHASLEKVDLLMKMDRSKQGYNFNNEFFSNLRTLRNKLRSFKLFLIVFSEVNREICHQVKKIILPTDVANRRFNFKSHYF